MGIDLGFYLERRSPSGGWEVPSELVRGIAGTADPIPLSRCHRRSRLREVFEGPRAVFAPHETVPDDLSELLAISFCIRPHPLAPAGRPLLDRPEGWAGWLMVDDLMLDLWPTHRVQLVGRAPEALLSCFGDGRSAFPDEALARAGMSREARDDLRSGATVTDAVHDYTGPMRHLLHRPAEGGAREVTWSERLFALDPPVARDLARATDFGAADRLRLCLRWS